MTDTRTRIRDHVRANPGRHFNALARELDLAPGQVQYHLRRLLGEDLIRETYYGQTHYYPAACGPWDRGAYALARRETARRILVALLRRGVARPGAVAEELGVARSTLEWHLSHLVEQGLVEKRRGERNRVSLALARPADTARVLDRVDPSLADRLLDRFQRLVDRLLADAAGSEFEPAPESEFE